MSDTNEITGARLVSKVPTKEFNEGYDRIWGKVSPCQGHAQHSWTLGEDATEVKQEPSGTRTDGGGCCGECC